MFKTVMFNPTNDTAALGVNGAVFMHWLPDLAAACTVVYYILRVAFWLRDRYCAKKSGK